MGECFFWHWPTRVVPDQRPLNGRQGHSEPKNKTAVGLAVLTVKTSKKLYLRGLDEQLHQLNIYDHLCAFVSVISAFYLIVLVSFPCDEYHTVSDICVI